MREHRASRIDVFTWLVGLSVFVLLVSNLASTKMFDFFGTGLVMDGGAVVFPLAYVLNDVIVELYGFRRARKIVIVTVAMNLLAALVFLVVMQLPPGPGWENQDAFATILGFAPRIAVASFIAYLIGQVLNAYVFDKLRATAAGGRHLWWRALGSSLVGDLTDTVLFTAIAFAGTITTPQLFGLMAIAYLMKIIGQIVLTPITYLAVSTIRKLAYSDESSALVEPL